ncbi:MAG: bifunctional histidinol-phosphatase/imidazoleglycerol-phosphate dehydratase HisB [Rikenellaceae bacterium]|jgi:imidazoleglycerol-phosphate dehydratase/histidinol-phosphatase|nr:bifunctional histidinol-phosphatase/imidazoleglycerol-phosphate dehydratase HisB [Rikenellaceae bacterium]
MEAKQKILFIDRDGTLIIEPPTDFQVDRLEKLTFVPGAIGAMTQIARLDYKLVMVTNQDGLGTSSFPEETFWPVQNKMLETLKGEGIVFGAIHIDPSLPEENKPTRKPGTAMLTEYFSDTYDLPGSFVVGDRLTDIRMAKNLGAKGVLIQPEEKGRQMLHEAGLEADCALVTDDWWKIYAFLRCGARVATVARKTRETDITLTLDLDGRGKNYISTGLCFFDHMLEQIVHHAGVSIDLKACGDLHVDEHHTVEDVAIVLGEVFRQALGSKLGIGRYGFSLPMDESEATVLLDFGGRIDFLWEVAFTRERVGDMPTEMFRHFFKSFAEAARCNLHIRAMGDNEHHKAEAVFKAFARSLRMAIARNPMNLALPSSKGTL